MKKLYYLIAMALMGLTFTSCEDVPAPFGQPQNPNQGSEETIDPKGSGTTEADPFNVAAAINKCKEVGEGGSSEKYYIKGIVVEEGVIPEGDTYGNITFKIADTKDSKKVFIAYQVFGSDGEKLPVGFKVNVDAEVVLYGPVVNYKNNTPETQGKGAAHIVTINGKKTSGDTPSGGDSGSSTGNMAKSTDGLVVSFTNANVTGSDKVTVDFSTLNLTSGNEIPELTLTNGTKITFAANENSNPPKYYNDGVRIYAKNSMTITGSKKIAKVVLNCITYTSGSGDAAKTVNAIGNEQMYGNADGNTVVIKNDYTQPSSGTQLRFKTMEITFEGEGSGDTGGDTGGDAGSVGTYSNPYTVTAGIAAEGEGAATKVEKVYVKGYIVGWVEGQALAEGARFNGTATSRSNILIAESATETDLAKCMPVQLPSNAVRTGMNLQDHAEYYKKEVLLYGNLEKYFGAAGVKSVTYAEIDESSFGTKPE